MRRLDLRESALFHLAAILGVVMLAAVLAAGPLGRPPLQAHNAAGPTDSLALSGVPSGPSLAAVEGDRTAESTLSARGSRDSGLLVAQTRPPGAAEPGRQSADSEEVEVTAAVAGGSETAAPFGDPDREPTEMAVTPPAPGAQTADAPAVRFRVGIQAGHWKNPELPAELAGLKGSTGAAGNGWREVDINLDIARRVAALLERAMVQVDLIPATVPPGYAADAFVALHGDANSNTSLSGYKLARARWSRIPQLDDALLAALSAEYRSATGLPEHRATITNAMLAYYAFDNRNLVHAVAPTTPAVILEMGFLTTVGDRRLLIEQPDRAAEGIARGILRFLGRK